MILFLICEFNYQDGVLTITGSGKLEPFSDYPEATTINVVGYNQIGDYVFVSRVNLEYLNLCDSITYIGNQLLAGTKVRVFHIPLSLSSFTGYQSFDQAEFLESFTIDPNHQYYAVVDGVLYSKDLKTLCCYPGGKKGTVFNIPQGTETVFNAAIGFNKNLRHVIIPYSVRSVAGLGYLSSITNVTIFRCTDETLMDVAGTSENLFPWMPRNTEIKWMYTEYQYEISSDEKIMSVSKMKCNAKGKKDIEFNEENIFTSESLETIKVSRDIVSISIDKFIDCPNLKTINIEKDNSKHITRICYMRSTLYLIFICNLFSI